MAGPTRPSSPTCAVAAPTTSAGTGAAPAARAAAVPTPHLSAATPVRQGLTLVHFSAQLEPCLSQENTLHTLHTPLTLATQPLSAPPIPYKALKLS